MIKPTFGKRTLQPLLDVRRLQITLLGGNYNDFKRNERKDCCRLW